VASATSPRDMTFGSINSLGLPSVFRGLWAAARALDTRRSHTEIPPPALPAQRLRAVLSSRPSPESLLQRRLPPSGPALATSSSEPGLASERGGQELPSRTVAALSAANSAGRAVGTTGDRTDRGNAASGRVTGGRVTHSNINGGRGRAADDGCSRGRAKRDDPSVDSDSFIDAASFAGSSFTLVHANDAIPAGRRAARGPAPNHNLCGFFRSDVQASRLL